MSADISTESQALQILAHLKSGKSITFLQALKLFGVMHLPRRIKDLKEAGHGIDDEWVKENGKRFKRYFLAPDRAPELT